jgi:hypothetical protein
MLFVTPLVSHTAIFHDAGPQQNVLLSRDRDGRTRRISGGHRCSPTQEPQGPSVELHNTRATSDPSSNTCKIITCNTSATSSTSSTPANHFHPRPNDNDNESARAQNRNNHEESTAAAAAAPSDVAATSYAAAFYYRRLLPPPSTAFYRHILPPSIIAAFYRHLLPPSTAYRRFSSKPRLGRC